MEPNQDITSFWLAWHETCSIRRCLDVDVLRRECKDVPEVMKDPEKVVKDARDVIETTNVYFSKMIRSPRKVKPLKGYASETSGSGNEHGTDGAGGHSDEDGRDSVRPEENPAVGISQSFDSRMGSSRPSSSVWANFSDIKEDKDDEVVPNKSFKQGVETKKRGRMVSEYIDLVASWDQHDYGATSAFELVEIDLYSRTAKESGVSGHNAIGVEPMLNGKKLKDYLFEDIGARPGGICKNLWGYLLKEGSESWGISRLRMVANQSFKNPVEEMPLKQLDGIEKNDEIADPSFDKGSDDIAVRQAGAVFANYLSQKWTSEFDVTDRVAICCAFFEYVMSDPAILRLVPVGGSAFNARKTKRVSDIFRSLKDAGCSFEDVRELFREEGQSILYRIAVTDKKTRDEACVKLVEHHARKKADKPTEISSCGDLSGVE